MKIYKSKIKRLAGTDYYEVYSKAKFLYKTILSKTKRRPYVRSAYFNKEKVFLDYFWSHIGMKNQGDRFRRLKQYACAIDLIRHSKIKPTSKLNSDKPSEILHRFSGINGSRDNFFVQITENIKNKEKSFMSVFPDD